MLFQLYYLILLNRGIFIFRDTAMNQRITILTIITLCLCPQMQAMDRFEPIPLLIGPITLTEHNQLKDWRQAFVTGRVKATGVDQYLKLIQQVVDKQEERSRLKKAKH